MSNTNVILLTAQRLMKRRKMGKSLTGKDLGKGITQRKDGLYQGSFGTGSKRRTVYGKTLKDVKEKLTQVKRGDTKPKRDTMALDIWFDVWLNASKAHCRDSTKQTYKVQYKRIKPLLGDKDIHSLKKVDIQVAVNSMDTYAKRRRSKEILYDIFKTAVENDIIEKNPCEGVKVIKDEEAKDKRILSDTEITYLMEELKGTTYMYDITLLALNTGMRIGEILGLHWCDVDFEAEEIHVCRTLTFIVHEGYKFHETKTDKGKRTIPMLEAVKEMLLRRHETSKGELVFATRNGTPLDGGNVREYYRKHFKEILKKHPEVNYDGVTPHSFRHTFATNCIENGMKPKVLQKILGHSTLSMTMDLYCHVRDESVALEMKKCCKSVV